MRYLVPFGFGLVSNNVVVQSLPEGKPTAWFSPQFSPIRQKRSVSLGEISHLPQHTPFSSGNV